MIHTLNPCHTLRWETIFSEEVQGDTCEECNTSRVRGWSKSPSSGTRAETKKAAADVDGLVDDVPF